MPGEGRVTIFPEWGDCKEKYRAGYINTLLKFTFSILILSNILVLLKRTWAWTEVKILNLELLKR